MNETTPAPSRRERLLNALPYAALGLFILLTFILIPRHELWRDESADWLYTRWGPSLGAVLHDLGYQMDPAGWHTALYVLAKVVPHPLAMQVFHSLMAIVGVFLFVRYAPFSRLEKCLYPFGFFVFYEYNIIARNYAPVLMFLCIIATVYGSRFRRPWLFAALLFLLAQSHMFGAMFSGTLALFYGIELLGRHRLRWRAYRPYVAPMLLLGAGYLLTLYQLIPLDEVRDTMGVSGEIDYYATFRGVMLRMIAPVIKPTIAYWPVNTVSDKHSMTLALVYLAGILYLVHARPVPLAYFLAMGGMLMYMLVFRGSVTRFIGMLYLLLIFTLWLQKYYPAAAPLADTRWMKRWYPRARRIILAAFLLLQAAGSPTAFWYDYHYPFSGGKETAEFLNANLAGTNVLIGTWLSYATQSVQPYLRDDVPAFFNVEQQRFYQGLIHDAAWYREARAFGPGEAFQRLLRQARQHDYDQVLLITIAPLQARAEGFMRLLGRFPAAGVALCGDEIFYVYELHPNTHRTPAGSP